MASSSKLYTPLPPFTLLLPLLQHLQFWRQWRVQRWGGGGGAGEHLLGGVGSSVRALPPHHDGVSPPSHQDTSQVLVPQEFPLPKFQGEEEQKKAVKIFSTGFVPASLCTVG